MDIYMSLIYIVILLLNCDFKIEKTVRCVNKVDKKGTRV